VSLKVTGSGEARLRGPAPIKDPSGSPMTIGETLRRTALDHGNQGIQIRDRSGRRSDRRNYPELLQWVERYCGHWRAVGLTKGDRVLLCLNTSWEFIGAWLGAICIGAYPVAIAPAVGGLKGSNHFADRMETFRGVVGASRLLISERMVEDLRKSYPESLGAIALTVEELSKAGQGDQTFEAADPNDLAFLQFTSGSTGTPRAVQISHLMAVRNALNINEGSVFLTGKPVAESKVLHTAWLPMHHDMGLIGCLMFSLCCGLELSLMNPATFLARPLRYLETAHQKNGLLSGPNFGFQFCVDRLSREDLAGLDLSRVGAAMTGSEMIRPETMNAFCDLLEGTGFRREAIQPCYGMAEATLAVTFDRKLEGVRAHPIPQVSEYSLENKEVVCVGVPVPDTEVIIAGPGGNVLRENELGEVQVRGPSVFSGYYDNEESSRQALREEWLKTGDIGFVADGELYIAGRSKEILVIRGENVMPHEIEWLAEEARGESSSAERTAAFSVAREHSGEEIALVVETHLTEKTDLQRLECSIRSRIGRGLSLPVADLLFVRRGAIPRTSSGKIQRGKIKQLFLEGAIEKLDVD
jgi:fatty-acyl-CoA synthase